MALKQISVPDVGEAEGIELVEVLVAAGDVVKQNQSLVVLESDKASVELPAAFDGVVVAVLMTPRMTVKEGDVLLTIETSRFQLLDKFGVSVGIRSNVVTGVVIFLKHDGNPLFFGFNRLLYEVS